MNVGTIISGTLREEDLVPAFIAALDDLNKGRCAEIRSEYQDVLGVLAASGTDGVVEENLTDGLKWLMEDLEDALDEAAPRGYRFGTNEGDGADFGFWECEEEMDDEN